MPQWLTHWGPIVAGGMIGALVRSLIIHKGSIILWRRWEAENGTRGVDLGIGSSLIIGAVVGIMVDQSFFTAFSWAICGSYLIEERIKAKTGEKIPKDDDGTPGGDTP